MREKVTINYSCKLIDGITRVALSDNNNIIISKGDQGLSLDVHHLKDAIDDLLRAKENTIIKVQGENK